MKNFNLKIEHNLLSDLKNMRPRVPFLSENSSFSPKENLVQKNQIKTPYFRKEENNPNCDNNLKYPNQLEQNPLITPLNQILVTPNNFITNCIEPRTNIFGNPNLGNNTNNDGQIFLLTQMTNTAPPINFNNVPLLQNAQNSNYFLIPVIKPENISYLMLDSPIQINNSSLNSLNVSNQFYFQDQNSNNNQSFFIKVDNNNLNQYFLLR